MSRVSITHCFLYAGLLVGLLMVGRADVKSESVATAARQSGSVTSTDHPVFAFSGGDAATKPDIYTMTVGSDTPTNLTSHSAADIYPTFSPTEDRIVFNSHRAGGWYLYSMKRDGSDQRRLFEAPGYQLHADFSPDGRRLTYFSNEGSRYWEIYTASPDGSNRTRLTDAGANNRNPSFSPDGSKILFYSQRDGNWNIYVMTSDGREQVRLTDHAADDYGPCWSPDGTSIAFYSDRDDVFDVYVMAADGSNQRKIYSSGLGQRALGDAYKDARLDWSAATEEILFTGGRLKNGTMQIDIYAMQPDGSNLRKLSGDRLTELHPTWAP